MPRIPLLIGLASLGVSAACAPLSPRAERVQAPGPDVARWIDGPNPEIHTLLLPPSTVTSLENGSHGPVDLSVGAFYSRWERDGARMEQLALLFQLEGDDRQHLEAMAEDLRLVMDGALYKGEPGRGANGRFLEPVEGRHRLSVAIPVCAEVLQTFIEAEAVRGQLGASQVFRLPPADRRRLRGILEQVPPDMGTFVSTLTLSDEE